MDFDRMFNYSIQLELNNNRQWFHENHRQYEEAKDDFEELVELLKFTVANCASGLQDVILQSGKKMMYRIPRDVRVYRNAPPYNPTFRAYIAPDKRANLPMGYFIMIAPGDRSHFGTGVYTNDSTEILKVRDYIFENFHEIDSIISENNLKIEGEKLKKVPSAYPGDCEAGELLKHKSWYSVRYFKDSELNSFDDFLTDISEEIKRMEPFREFMTSALTGINTGI